MGGNSRFVNHNWLISNKKTKQGKGTIANGFAPTSTKTSYPPELSCYSDLVNIFKKLKIQFKDSNPITIIGIFGLYLST